MAHGPVLLLACLTTEGPAGATCEDAGCEELPAAAAGGMLGGGGHIVFLFLQRRYCTLYATIELPCEKLHYNVPFRRVNVKCPYALASLEDGLT